MPTKNKDSPQYSCKIIVVGVGGTGKTALIHQFMYNKFVDTYFPTAADNFSVFTHLHSNPQRKVVDVEGESYQVDILDTAGQEDVMRDNYYKSGDGFLCVFALNMKESLAAIPSFRDHIIAVKGMEDIPLILVGNKSDLEGREVEKSKGEEMARQFNCLYFETSAKDAINVEAVFIEILKQVHKTRVEVEENKPKSNKCFASCILI